MANINKPGWCCLFSQTGSEILEVSKQLKRLPDVIIYNTNFGTLPPINPELIKLYDSVEKVINILPARPSAYDYYDFIHAGSVVTLHGWLRIIPPEVCTSYEIYNGHPGLISKFPNLKGKDPQEKAFNLQLKTSGCVIHRVTAGVDEGEVLKEQEVNIENLELASIISKLHDTSVDMWVKFLSEKLK